MRLRPVDGLGPLGLPHHTVFRSQARYEAPRPLTEGVGTCPRVAVRAGALPGRPTCDGHLLTGPAGPGITRARGLTFSSRFFRFLFLSPTLKGGRERNRNRKNSRMTRNRCYRNDFSATHSGVSSHSVRRQPVPTRLDSSPLSCLTLHVKIKPLRGLRPAAPQADRLGDLIRPTISIPSPPLALRSESKSRAE
nr:MAG TPA: hypothetical protein [Caudoviricetes sp.]